MLFNFRLFYGFGGINFKLLNIIFYKFAKGKIMSSLYINNKNEVLTKSIIKVLSAYILLIPFIK